MNDRMMQGRQVMMNAEKSILSLQGPVSFDTAAQMAREGRRLLQQVEQGSTLSIDARGVQFSSSATLTIILEWWRALNVRELSLKEVLLPEQMKPLVALSGLSRILPGY